MGHNLGLRHLHARKKHHATENIPPRAKHSHLLDYFVYFASCIGPIMTIPQIWTIWAHQSAVGVSGISWFTYLFVACVWLAYGIVHKELPIIISNISWIVLDIIIVVGVVLYG